MRYHEVVHLSTELRSPRYLDVALLRIDKAKGSVMLVHNRLRQTAHKGSLCTPLIPLFLTLLSLATIAGLGVWHVVTNRL